MRRNSLFLNINFSKVMFYFERNDENRKKVFLVIICFRFTKQVNMESEEIFIKGKRTYFKWRKERQDVIDKLEKIKVEIQKVANVYDMASTGYSTASITTSVVTAGALLVSTVFPPALIFAAAGAGVGALAGVADVTHGAIKFGIILSLCKDAQKISEEHEKTGRELINWLKILYEKLTIENALYATGKVAKGVGSVAKGQNALKYGKAAKIYRKTGDAAKAAKALKIGNVMQRVLPNAAKEVFHGVTIVSRKAISAFALFSVAMDIRNIHSCVERLSKGQLCDEAAKLQNAIETLKREMENFKEIFE